MLFRLRRRLRRGLERFGLRRRRRRRGGLRLGRQEVGGVRVLRRRRRPGEVVAVRLAGVRRLLRAGQRLRRRRRRRPRWLLRGGRRRGLFGCGRLRYKRRFDGRREFLGRRGRHRLGRRRRRLRLRRRPEVVGVRLRLRVNLYVGDGAFRGGRFSIGEVMRANAARCAAARAARSSRSAGVSGGASTSTFGGAQVQATEGRRVHSMGPPPGLNGRNVAGW